jgi:hypothetical protein
MRINVKDGQQFKCHHTLIKTRPCKKKEGKLLGKEFLQFYYVATLTKSGEIHVINYLRIRHTLLNYNYFNNGINFYDRKLACTSRTFSLIRPQSVKELRRF